MSQIDLSNRVAVITGAGGGLGRSHALLLAKYGARIVVNDLGGSTDGQGSDSSAAALVVKEIEAAGGEAVANFDSVATPEGAAGIIKSAIDTWGRVDIVVNNAGILRDKSILKMTTEDLDLVLAVHLRGTILVTQAAFGHMKEAGYGRLIHTTSAAGIFGNFGQANYGAAKLGIAGFSRVIAEEGARSNILSNVIAPVAATRLTRDLFGPLVDKLLPEHVSPLVAYLASESCTISREVISVGGGRFARVFTGLGPGWVSPDENPVAPEDVADHISEIMSTEGFVIPTNALEEIGIFATLHGNNPNA